MIWHRLFSCRLALVMGAWIVLLTVTTRAQVKTDVTATQGVARAEVSGERGKVAYVTDDAPKKLEAEIWPLVGVAVIVLTTGSALLRSARTSNVQ